MVLTTENVRLRRKWKDLKDKVLKISGHSSSRPRQKTITIKTPNSSRVWTTSESIERPKARMSQRRSSGASLARKSLRATQEPTLADIPSMIPVPGIRVGTHGYPSRPSADYIDSDSLYNATVTSMNDILKDDKPAMQKVITVGSYGVQVKRVASKENLYDTRSSIRNPVFLQALQNASRAPTPQSRSPRLSIDELEEGSTGPYLNKPQASKLEDIKPLEGPSSSLMLRSISEMTPGTPRQVRLSSNQSEPPINHKFEAVPENPSAQSVPQISVCDHSEQPDEDAIMSDSDAELAEVTETQLRRDVLGRGSIVSILHNRIEHGVTKDDFLKALEGRTDISYTSCLSDPMSRRALYKILAFLLTIVALIVIAFLSFDAVHDEPSCKDAVKAGKLVYCK